MASIIDYGAAMDFAKLRGGRWYCQVLIVPTMEPSI